MAKRVLLQMSHNTHESSSLTRHMCLIFLLCKEEVLSRIWTFRWHANKPLPVEQVVSRHHAQEASRIGDWVELVVEFFKLLVQKITRLALCLTARTAPDGDRKRFSTIKILAEGGTKWLSSTADNTEPYIVSSALNQLHTLPIRHKYTLFNPHTWPNFPALSRQPDDKHS